MFTRMNSIFALLVSLLWASHAAAATYNPPPCTEDWHCDYKPTISGTVSGPSKPCHGESQTYRVNESSMDGKRSRCGVKEDVGVSPIAWSWSLSGPETAGNIGNSFSHTFRQSGTYTVTFKGYASRQGGDPCEHPDSATATMEVVVDPDSGSATLADASACPGETAVMPWSITNSGSCSSTFSWLAYPLEGDLQVALSPTVGSVTLAPGQTKHGSISVQVPANAGNGFRTIRMDVDTSVTRGIANPSANVTVNVNPRWTARADDLTICPGERDAMGLFIKNDGCSTESFGWRLTKVGPPTLTFAPSAGSMPNVARGEERASPLINVLVGPLSRPGLAVVNVAVTTRTGTTTQNDVGSVEVPAPQAVASLLDASVDAGSSTNITLKIENKSPCRTAFAYTIRKRSGDPLVTFGDRGVSSLVGAIVIAGNTTHTNDQIVVNVPRASQVGKATLEVEVRALHMQTVTGTSTLSVSKVWEGPWVYQISFIAPFIVDNAIVTQHALAYERTYGSFPDNTKLQGIFFGLAQLAVSSNPYPDLSMNEDEMETFRRSKEYRQLMLWKRNFRVNSDRRIVSHENVAGSGYNDGFTPLRSDFGTFYLESEGQFQTPDFTLVPTEYVQWRIRREGRLSDILAEAAHVLQWGQAPWISYDVVYRLNVDGTYRITFGGSFFPTHYGYVEGSVVWNQAQRDLPRFIYETGNRVVAPDGYLSPTVRTGMCK